LVVPEPILVAMQLLRGVRRKGDVGRLATEILALLERADAELRAGQKPVRRESRRSNAGIEYVVETTAAGEVLTEKRLSGKSQPFRCPKAVYDAVAQVLGKTDRALSVDEIAEDVKGRLGDRPADFQLRVPLRLWMHVQPPLLLRGRARYRSTMGDNFVLVSVRLWNALAKH
jgi:hypothetical protein